MTITMLIDPPIGPYGPPDEIRDWLRRLSALPQDRAEVIEATAEAQAWLAAAEVRATAER